MELSYLLSPAGTPYDPIKSAPEVCWCVTAALQEEKVPKLICHPFTYGSAFLQPQAWIGNQRIHVSLRLKTLFYLLCCIKSALSFTFYAVKTF